MVALDHFLHLIEYPYKSRFAIKNYRRMNDIQIARENKTGAPDNTRRTIYYSSIQSG